MNQEYVFIPEYISDSDNCWDGRTRYGIHLSLKSALDALSFFADKDDPLITTETTHYDSKDGSAWMVHRTSEAPNEVGSLWIFKEKVVT